MCCLRYRQGMCYLRYQQGMLPAGPVPCSLHMLPFAVQVMCCVRYWMKRGILMGDLDDPLSWKLTPRLEIESKRLEDQVHAPPALRSCPGALRI